MCEAGSNPRDQALPAILFQTGSRVSEVIRLSAKHFNIAKEWVTCLNTPLVKQKKVTPYRSFSFPIDEPVWKFSEKWINICKNRSYLFPHTRQWAYRKVVKLGQMVGVKVWSHWFRSMRASQVRLEYGLTGVELREWFKVRDLSWDQRYSKLGVTGLQNIIEKAIRDKNQ